MEVKINSNLIRAERESRGWSQEHLASVAGLSLRTIQRIEKTGSASFESATALASVLSVTVSDLRARQAEPGLLKRALGLIGASTLSYFCAMTAMVSEEWFPVAPDLSSFIPDHGTLVAV